MTDARGNCRYKGKEYELVDIPGCYSLQARSAEEEVARDFICFFRPDAVVVVCDATCLERNLNLVLQILEAASRVVVCINLMDEAAKKKIHIDVKMLSKRLGVPVIPTVARSKKGLNEILECLQQMEKKEGEITVQSTELRISYPEYVEYAAFRLEKAIQKVSDYQNTWWLAIRLLEQEEGFLQAMKGRMEEEIVKEESIKDCLHSIKEEYENNNISEGQVKDAIAASLVKEAEMISKEVIHYGKASYNRRDRILDKVFTSKLMGFPVMFLGLFAVFWLTISGANIPSELLSRGFFWIEEKMIKGCQAIGVPSLLYQPAIFGVYRVVAWVVSVMLPPMAIFFPMFALLEDFGYLPRVAFNLDRCFKRCHACGKQALTMCMGFGCNAAGVVGCRIIDSPRERLIAILTNNFVPCNGRLPVLISIITMFFVSSLNGWQSSLLCALLLSGMILMGVVMTLLISKLLSMTILKGIPSSFTLELPPYRKPQVGKVIVRSMLDKTLFVLGRAVLFAVPAGFVLWLMTNITVGGVSLLIHCASFLDPFARVLGMDGVILLAFILGLPANEIVMPIILMAYLAKGSLTKMDDILAIRGILTANGWTWVTAVSTMLFSLFHWPCSTTCMTIKKETQSFKWMAVGIAVPTLVGIIVCGGFQLFVRILGIA